MGLYDLFGTDNDLEKEGFALEYGDATFVIARAGGSNEKFQRCIERKMRPYRAAINSGTMVEETSRKLLAEAYAETIVLAWDGVTDRDGNVMDFSKENIVKLFLDLPDLFTEIINESSRISNFVAMAAEADAKS
jgi:hypothetical protein